VSRSDPSAGLRLLVLADLHYVNSAEHVCAIPARKGHMARELMRRAFLRASRASGNIDGIVFMGDMVDNGLAARAEEDLAELRDEANDLGVPCVIVPGNHDGSPDRLLRVFDDTAGLHEIGGVRLLSFADRYDENDVCTRSLESTEQALAQCSNGYGGPLIALQHSPIHPSIESDYPYMLQDRERVMGAYRDARVALSISGHYHPGQPPTQVDGVTYVTCPALCEAPFGFLVVRIHEGLAEIEEHSLAMDPALGLEDLHCHTHYAYCAKDVTAEAVIERARDFGLSRIYLTEHAAQLYLAPEDFWRGAFIREPDIWLRERNSPRSRMEAFRAEVSGLRSDDVRLGMEVECDGLGRLTLADEDREGWDLLVGAVHYLPGTLTDDPDLRTVAREFLSFTESLLRGGVDTLAHPFRLFRRAKWGPSTDREDVRCAARELYAPVADLLAECGVAAEVNYHTNEPDAEFFAMCIERGVRIALGSDSHWLGEVGEFAPHLDLLRRASASEDWGQVLYQPV